ncbi:predicted protein [Sclerotinia sclerotiorum 1980 UF-70]|uniref:Uncharacterized protein n=1 Tax=Sclerotinia sclerotiorum (strain ATCC 18683 / 1980 / Ss-1) TaxID=665079 RepID=A7E451_SCLS1|nr:predicted protein [Sclerotinia sclerotiorum 1980 UF-70]EDN90673.1 predicted protein [Sclerotinia sclerotiorum 1980 UF-70]
MAQRYSIEFAKPDSSHGPPWLNKISPPLDSQSHLAIVIRKLSSSQNCKPGLRLEGFLLFFLLSNSA